MIRVAAAGFGLGALLSTVSAFIGASALECTAIGFSAGAVIAVAVLWLEVRRETALSSETALPQPGLVVLGDTGQHLDRGV